MVQGLRLYASTAMGVGSISVQGTKIPRCWVMQPEKNKTKQNSRFSHTWAGPSAPGHTGSAAREAGWQLQNHFWNMIPWKLQICLMQKSVVLTHWLSLQSPLTPLFALRPAPSSGTTCSIFLATYTFPVSSSLLYTPPSEHVLQRGGCRGVYSFSFFTSRPQPDTQTSGTWSVFYTAEISAQLQPPY